MGSSSAGMIKKLIGEGPATQLRFGWCGFRRNICSLTSSLFDSL